MKAILWVIANWETVASMLRDGAAVIGSIAVFVKGMHVTAEKLGKADASSKLKKAGEVLQGIADSAPVRIAAMNPKRVSAAEQIAGPAGRP